MRVLFVVVPAKAHLYPVVPMAWALRAAGHEVRIASTPELTEEIAATGLTAVALGPALEQAEMIESDRPRREEQEAASAPGLAELPDPELLMRMDEPWPEKLDDDTLQGLFTVMTTLVFRSFSPDAAIGELVAFARSWQPDLIVWDTLLFAAPVAARACGAAHARMLYGLDLVGSMRQWYLRSLAGRPEPLRDDPVREWLTPVLQRYGATFAEDVVTGQWTIDAVPPSMRLPVDLTSLPVRHVPYHGRSDVPAWLRREPGRRRICLTLGLSFREIMGGERVPVADLLEAVADLDAEVVATLDESQLAGVTRIPGNVRVAGFVPLNELLPGCAAIVHQGGFGQVQAALVHGVPQVVLPNGQWDTVLRARGLVERGVALAVPDPVRLTPQRLRRLIVRVLDESSFADSAAAVRAEIAAVPAPADVVRQVVELTAHHRARTGR